jgi:transketolase
LRDAFIKAKESIDKPTVIIANTTKGKGISFMENDILWHYRFPHEGEEYNSAVAELRAQMPEGITDMYEAGESFKEVAATKEAEEQ